jgi:quercetin dioxygenase-like cupin family protein
LASPSAIFDVQIFYVKSVTHIAMNETSSPCAAELIRIGQLEIRYLQEAGNGCELGCFELRVPPGSNVPPPHSHSANEELVYVLEGQLRYTVGNETRDLRPGETMATPRGVVHGFSNPHALPARALVINTPDIGAQYFREVRSVVDAGGPPERDKLTAVMSRFGLVLAAGTPPA